MPGGDRTGPSGLGPGTGRAMGFCSGYETPGYIKEPARGFGYGAGFGRRAGRGRGFGPGRGMHFRHYGYMQWNPINQALSREAEIRFLKSEAEAIKRSQNEIEKRLGELEKEGDK